eukprot:TRINITY_DN5047_c0_g1_i1.p1 TRINITY_DN5047_c0_g1~~TRINITY_DN5047_c0_g1_i1.p1  ORF type:complete len:731 (+),score=185.33 TRINITY_DN5047_c0_g1_i1:68-2194(+)
MAHTRPRTATHALHDGRRVIRGEPNDRKVVDVLLRAAAAGHTRRATEDDCRSIRSVRTPPRGAEEDPDLLPHDVRGFTDSASSVAPSAVEDVSAVVEAEVQHQQACALRRRPNLADRMFRHWHNAHGGGEAGRVLQSPSAPGAASVRGSPHPAPSARCGEEGRPTPTPHREVASSTFAEGRATPAPTPARRTPALPHDAAASPPPSAVRHADPSPMVGALHFRAPSETDDGGGAAAAEAEVEESEAPRLDAHLVCCHVCLGAAVRPRYPPCQHAVCAGCIDACQLPHGVEQAARAPVDDASSTRRTSSPSPHGERNAGYDPRRKSIPGAAPPPRRPTHRCRTCLEMFALDDVPPPVSVRRASRAAARPGADPMRACLDGPASDEAAAEDVWQGRAPPPCERCERFASAVVCVTCRAAFCDACHRTVHVGALRAHTVQPHSVAYLTDANSRLVTEGVCPVRGHGGAPLEWFDPHEGQFLCAACRTARFGVDEGEAADRCVPIDEAAAAAAEELHYAHDHGAGYMEHLRGSIRALQDAAGEVAANKRESIDEVKAVFASWRAELAAEEERWTARLEGFYDGEQEKVDRELTKGVAFLSTFLRHRPKVDAAARAAASGNPRRVIAARHTTRLSELMQLAAAPLHTPPLARLSAHVHRDVEWPHHVTSRMKEHHPGAAVVYRHQSDAPLPACWAEGSPSDGCDSGEDAPSGR